MHVQGSNVTATFNGAPVMSVNVLSLSSPNGFVAFGPDRFGVASFDNLNISRADRRSDAAAATTLRTGTAFAQLHDLDRNAENRTAVDQNFIDFLQQLVDDRQLL